MDSSVKDQNRCQSFSSPNADKEQLGLKFSAVRARWVQAEEWHPEQKSTVNKDGTYTLEFPYSDERELLGDILRFGADVEVLAPKSLRTSLLNAATETLKLYK